MLTDEMLAENQALGCCENMCEFMCERWENEQERLEIFEAKPYLLARTSAK